MGHAIVIGYDGTSEGEDALALARVLAGDDQSRLLAACIAGIPHHGRNIPALRERLEGDARAALAGIAGEGIDTRVEVSGSPAQGLFELAEAEDADLLVVGSSHHAGLGALRAGSVGRALLKGAPCGVAVAPRGYREGDADRLRVLGVAYDGTPQSEAALDGAIELGLRAGATLRVMSVAPRGTPGVAVGAHPHAALGPTPQEWMRERLAAAIDRSPPGLRALPVMLSGEPTRELNEEAGRGVDLLVVGYRGFGPLKRVMLGSVADALMQSAPCPVLVFPRRGRQAGPAAHSPA